MSIRSRERQRKDLSVAAVLGIVMALCFYVSHQIVVWLPTTATFTPYENWKMAIAIVLTVMAVASGIVSVVHVCCAIWTQE